MEAFQAQRYASIGVTQLFVQGNLVGCIRRVSRGLQLQNRSTRGKLVGLLCGWVLEVVVNLGRGSPTFGKSIIVELGEGNGPSYWCNGNFCAIGGAP